MKQIYINSKCYTVDESVANKIYTLDRKLGAWRIKALNLIKHLINSEKRVEQLKKTAIERLEVETKYLNKMLTQLKNRNEKI